MNKTGSLRPLLSIVIPVKNEADAIGFLSDDIGQAMSAAGFSWEALWVDDGSTDATPALLGRLPRPHRHLRMDRCHGQAAAIMAGAAHARGEWIGTLDGDGQNDPADLVRQVIMAHERGLDLVGGVRSIRCDSWVRRISSVLANRARRWWIGDTARDAGCSTRVVRRSVLLALPVFFDGMQLYLPDLLLARGCRIAEIPVNHRPRIGGRAKYGIRNRLGSGLRDLLGVRWLLDRQRCWQVREEGAPPATAQADHTTSARP